MIAERLLRRMFPENRTYNKICFDFFDWRLFSILFCIILIFLTAHIIAGAFMDEIPVMINISYDRSLPEWFCYGMLATASFMLLRAFSRERTPLLISFSAVLLLMLVDDSMTIHEVGGAMIAASLGDVSLLGLDLKDTGEMLTYGLMGLIILPFVIYGVIRTPFSEWHKYYALAIFVGLLGFFSVGIDLIHEPICRSVTLGGYCFQVVDLFEDGGEMFWEAVIVAHVSRAFGIRKLSQANGER